MVGCLLVADSLSLSQLSKSSTHIKDLKINGWVSVGRRLVRRRREVSTLGGFPSRNGLAYGVWTFHTACFGWDSAACDCIVYIPTQRSKRYDIIACSLVILALGVGDKDTEAVFCIRYEIIHLKNSSLCNEAIFTHHPHQKTIGCQREVPITNDEWTMSLH